MNNALYQILTDKRALSIDDAAALLEQSPDFVRGVISSDKRIRNVNGTVMLDGLGVDRCIVCTDPLSKYSGARLSIPHTLLGERKLDHSLRNGVRGHSRCYENEQIMSRYDVTSCVDCASFSGRWIDGDEVEERCSGLGVSAVGRKGILASNRMCNLYRPDSDVTSNPEFAAKKEAWEDLKSQVAHDTEEGYRRLIKILEECKLIGLSTLL